MKDKHVILVVEADGSICQQLMETAARKKLEVVCADYPDQVVPRAEALLPSAIVLNVDLNGGSGYALSNALRRHPVLKDVPIVLTSGDAEAQETFEQHHKLATRADDYLVKPYTPDQLLDVLAPKLLEPRAAVVDRLERSRAAATSTSSAASSSSVMWLVIVLIALVVIGGAAYLIYPR